ncbi:hypothetical protein BDV37DRAFT_89917 [Aspergillus pseudonomiae]|uniref:Uncharacterized protein n=1 Tax=Aspergillus pseudonomiae TaxID=1506151 RepID=A0A5N7DHS2_9EURO|nr:uncharacterized protein BDV37DRAFT_89917 [Aspergillus pseudonomiae]KAE8405573.1 hypothetical protein BDV37DRAFT_89917 [Aspergillus pseudonomiae]
MPPKGVTWVILAPLSYKALHTFSSSQRTKLAKPSGSLFSSLGIDGSALYCSKSMIHLTNLLYLSGVSSSNIPSPLYMSVTLRSCSMARASSVCPFPSLTLGSIPATRRFSRLSGSTSSRTDITFDSVPRWRQ